MENSAKLIIRTIFSNPFSLPLEMRTNIETLNAIQLTITFTIVCVTIA